MRIVGMCVVLLLVGCAITRTNKNNIYGSQNATNSYRIYKIDSINSYYLVYVKKVILFIKLFLKRK
jgi:outer membrane lipoprotein SlyB